MFDEVKSVEEALMLIEEVSNESAYTYRAEVE